jgi:hypothetical protein
LRYRLRGHAALLVCSALAGAALLSPERAHAAPVAADADAQAWMNAYAQGQWAAAIELLETIPESSRTPSHWLHLARALERRSQLVEAFAAYERVQDLAGEMAAPGMRELEGQAKLESSALARRIPWAEVSLAALPVGALVFIDQQWLEPARLRSPYPVNPGWHTFLVESNGEVLAARRAYFEEGQTRHVPLTALDANVAAAASLSEGATSAGKAEATHEAVRPRTLTWRPETQQHPDADADAGGLLRASYVTLGVGALGTLVGTGFLISTLNMRSAGDVGPNCFNSSCEAEAQLDADRARRRWRAHAAAATASYALGLTGLVMGGVFYLLHRDSSSHASSVNIADLSLELAPHFGPHGATLRGTF